MTEVEQPTRRLPRLDTYRILTLENPENIDKLKEACKSAGHEVVPVLTIGEGMSFLDRRDHVDVIVSGVHLQNESVFEFLQLVKNSEQHKDVPFLMVCVEPGGLGLVTSPAVEIAAQIMGADNYLLLPHFDADRLIEEIEKLLRPFPNRELDPEEPGASQAGDSGSDGAGYRKKRNNNDDRFRRM